MQILRELVMTIHMYMYYWPVLRWRTQEKHNMSLRWIRHHTIKNRWKCFKRHLPSKCDVHVLILRVPRCPLLSLTWINYLFIIKLQNNPRNKQNSSTSLDLNVFSPKQTNQRIIISKLCKGIINKRCGNVLQLTNWAMERWAHFNPGGIFFVWIVRINQIYSGYLHL